MTATSIQITQGSGTRLAANSYTEGGVTVNDEKMIFGESYLPSYTVGNTAVSTATAASHLLEIMAGSSLRTRIRRIEIHQITMATTATVMDTQVFRLTTAGTGGAAITPAPLDPADGAAVSAGMTLPTVKGTESTLIARGGAYMMQTVGASAQLANPVLVWDFDRPRSKPLIIPAGTANGICIKNGTAVAGGLVTIMVWIDESSF